MDIQKTSTPSTSSTAQDNRILPRTRFENLRETLSQAQTSLNNLWDHRSGRGETHSSLQTAVDNLLNHIWDSRKPKVDVPVQPMYGVIQPPVDEVPVDTTPTPIDPPIQAIYGAIQPTDPTIIEPTINESAHEVRGE